MKRMLQQVTPLVQNLQSSTIHRTHPQCLPLHHFREASQYRKVTPSASHGQLPPELKQTLDDAIGAISVQRVDENNKLLEPERLRALLQNIDRSKEHVRKVGEGANGVPIVKIVTKESLVHIAQVKEMLASKKDVAEYTKQIELNWAIDENDLGHRLKRIKDFLEDGKRVEVLIAPKRKGRRAETQEIITLLERVRETTSSVEGASEWKPMEGLPGKVVEMFFRGIVEKQSAKELIEAKDEKMNKKEAGKEARRLKEEARLAKRRKELEDAEKEKTRLARQMAEEARARLKQ